LDSVSRRLELLKLEGLGFSQAEIVKELSQKCTCSKSTVCNDLETPRKPLGISAKENVSNNHSQTEMNASTST
jgi:hypothetical protein